MRLVIVSALAAAIALVSLKSNANELYITQSGDNLTLTVIQQGENNQIKGVNTFSSLLNGDYNNITWEQYGTGHLIQSEIDGDNSTVDLFQSSLVGSHTANITLSGNDNIVNSVQSGTNNASLTLNLTSSGGAYNVTTYQDTTNTNQSYSLTGICTNTLGCSLNITQNQ